MPNGHGPKDYGRHEYGGHDGTSDCKYGCGCWMGPARSGGPAGIDPFGVCPGNPIDGKFLGGKQDYEHVVEERIRKLSSELSAAKEKIRQTDPDKLELAQKLQLCQVRCCELESQLSSIQKIIEPRQ